MRKRVLFLLCIAFITISCASPVAVKIFPTPTLAFTNTPQPTPTATSTPTPPPTPTPLPAVKVEMADQALFLGDYETARKEFQEAYNNASDPELKAAALLGMGRSLYLAQNVSTAMDAFKTLITNFPQSRQVADAYFFLGRCDDSQKIYDQAADAYGKYLELRPGVLDAYVLELRGDAYMAAGNPGAASTAYEAAIQAPQRGSTIWTELKLGKAYAARGDFANAIKRYLDIYNKSNNDYARAQANLLMGQAYMTMGEPEQAHARFMDSIANFPKAYDSYSGLVQLITDGVQVNELSRGMVDYYAGQYGLAIDAFTRYINSNSEQAAKAYYYRALSHMAKNEIGLAIDDFDTIIANYEADPLWPSAWEEKAYAQWAYLDKFDDAANTLLQYIQQSPESAQAPDFLFQAARIQERNNEFPQAAATWESLIDKYPQAENSYRGLFLAGVTYYRAKDYTKALTVFQRALVLGNTPEDQSAAYLWVGKTQQAKGDPAAANNAWQQAAQRDPTGYYSIRANELLQNLAPFEVNRPIDLGYDLNQERAQADAWMRTTFNLPADQDLNGLGDMASSQFILRGKAFWDLGLYSEAGAEFEALRQSVINDPVKTYQLMNYLLQLGEYRPAVLSSRQILSLANMDDISTLKAPAYFNHIRFGVYFKDQVVQASQDEKINPLFLLSMMRQESMFESYAESGAGARGLMQIMPATGHEIASGINWPDNYEDDDLYRPIVSITLGTRYMARQRDYFNGSLFAALAAYNGGPGNTIIWKDLAGDDPDLFLEVIRADETRTYLTQIYEFFNIYRLLYERGL